LLDIYKKDIVRYNSYKTYENVVKKHIIPNIGGVKLNKITSVDLQVFFNSLRNATIIGKYGVTKQMSTDSIYLVINLIFKQAIKNKYITHNPCQSVVRPKKQNTGIRVLSPDERLGFLNALKTESLRDRTMFTLALNTGMRILILLKTRYISICN